MEQLTPDDLKAIAELIGRANIGVREAEAVVALLKKIQDIQTKQGGQTVKEPTKE